MRLPSFILSLCLLLPGFSHAAAFDGATLSLWWGLPFAMILLSIALGPLIQPKFWHHYFGWITAFWTSLFLFPMLFEIQLKILESAGIWQALKSLQL